MFTEHHIGMGRYLVCVTGKIRAVGRATVRRAGETREGILRSQMYIQRI